jgi:hypothetical protein
MRNAHLALRAVLSWAHRARVKRERRWRGAEADAHAGGSLSVAHICVSLISLCFSLFTNTDATTLIAASKSHAKRK